MSQLLHLGLLAYAGLLLAMLTYGLNTVLLVAVHAWTHRRPLPLPPEPHELPVITVQLAVFNEANVVQRLLRAAGDLDWPRDRLQIQLLDDSTDDTPVRAAPVLAELRERGLDVQHLRRRDRRGFKAGALAEGMAVARGELLALFDADFVPPPGFLRRAVRWFDDPSVAAVQGRWTHLNRELSGLTRAQALGIDGHFGVEQGARCRAGWFMNFNGSAGVWRRRAIEDAGGWSGDTLTEDLDLSYRVQLNGWKIRYDPDLTCPSELPVDLAAFKAQQRRWATGSMQVARKLLPAVWRSGAGPMAKVQATLHLSHYLVHPLIALSALLSVPCVLLPRAHGTGSAWMMVLLFAVAMSGPTLLHVYSQRRLDGRWVSSREMGLMTLIGVGLAVSNSRAVLAAFGKGTGVFVRTPKLGLVSGSERPATRYRASGDGLAVVELLLAVYCGLAVAAFALAGTWEIVPFIALDGVGLCWVASRGWWEARA